MVAESGSIIQSSGVLCWSFLVKEEDIFVLINPSNLRKNICPARLRRGRGLRDLLVQAETMSA
jgi:hypothetical protein